MVKCVFGAENAYAASKIEEKVASREGTRVGEGQEKKKRVPQCG